MLLTLIQTLVAWLGLFVAIGGVALSVPHLARSKWVMFLAGAFAVEAVVLLFYRLSSYLINAVIPAGIMSTALLGCSVVLLVARGSIVAGILGLISELPVPAKSASSEFFGS